MHTQRLLNAARAVRERAAIENFTMACYFHECGTPGCVLGTYALRTDMQTDISPTLLKNHRESAPDDIDQIAEHFDLTSEQVRELFAYNGCGKARTPEQAAAYIEAFVTRHSPRALIPESVARIFRMSHAELVRELA